MKSTSLNDFKALTLLIQILSKVEKNIGRKLNRTKNGKGEGVHHIDGDKLNNKLENLFLYSDEKEHSKIHQSLKNIASFLVKEGKILFNNITKTYELHEQ